MRGARRAISRSAGRSQPRIASSTGPVQHGDEPTPVPLAAREIVEEVAAFTLPDGYEVNATFAADDRWATPDDVETALRRLAFARSDLLAVVDRVHEFESGGGGLIRETRSSEARATGADDGKDVDQILRHIAGAETWFVSRLDPSARYTGGRDDTADYLAGSREFLADGLRRLQQAGAEPRTDSKGERWTLAKLLRRAVYHSLDHLEELDRRLAVAERRVERIELRHDTDIDPLAVAPVVCVGRTEPAGGRQRRVDEEMARRNERDRHGLGWDRLVGFARMLSDEATNAYVSTVAVAPRWQDRGLGTRIMRSLMEGRESMKLVLEAAVGAERFYERLGFVRAPNAFVRPRPQ